MASPDHLDLFVMVSGGLLLLLQGAVWIRALARQRLLKSQWCQICSAFTHAAEMLRSAQKAQPEDEMSCYVRQRMDSQSLDSMRSLASKVGIMYSLGVAMLLLSMWRGVHVWMTPFDAVLWIVSTGVFVTLQLVPSLMRVSRLGLCYSVLMAKACIDMGLGGQPQMKLTQSGALWVLRILYGLAYRKVPAVLFWNVVYFVVALDAYRRMFLAAPVNKSCSGDFQKDNYDALVLYEFLSLCIVIFTATSAAQATRSQARQEFSATTLRAESSALTTMLNLVCDVVVELDKDLRIKGDSQRFAALLAMEPHRVQDQQFQHFMPLEEDGTRLQEALLGKPPEGSSDFEAVPSCTSSGQAACQVASSCQAGVVHVKLRDSWGNSIPVEVFYVQSECLGQVSFFIGLREHADQGISALRSFDAAARQPQQVRQSRRRERRLCDRGTPPTMLGRSLGAEHDSSSESSLSSAVGSQGRDGAAAEAARGTEAVLYTGASGMDLTLVDAMLRWHLCYAEDACCPFHAAVAKLKSSAQRLEGYACMPVFRPDGINQGQCSKCRLIFEKSDLKVNGLRLCKFCGTLCNSRSPAHASL